MMPAIASPSLNSATKARISGAPGRVRNSRSGSTTACAQPGGEARPADAALRAGGGSGASRVTTSPSADQRRDAQQRRVPADDADGRIAPVLGDQQRDAVAPDIGRHRRPLAARGEDLDAPGVDDDVLAGGQEGDQRGEAEREQRQARRVGQRQQRGGGASAGWIAASQPRRRPRRRSGPGGGALSSTGAQRNFSE